MNIFKILRLLFLLNFSIFKPQKSKIAVFDEVNSELITKFLKKYNYQVISTRLESINLYILLKVFFSKKKLNFRNYIIKYLEVTNSKLIFCGFDNNLLFLSLKDDLKNIQTICIQQGWRGPFFFKKIRKKYKKLKSDLFFTFNKKFSKKFARNIKSEFIEIGSFISNSVPRIKKKNSSSIGYISELSWGSTKNYMQISDYKIAVKKFFYHDTFLLQEVSNFCIKKKIKLKIIGKLNLPWEREFYNSILGEKNFTFIPNYRGRNVYKLCDNLKFTVGSFSTLLLENFSRGNVTAIFNTKILSTKNEDFNIFFPNKIANNGDFWTKYINKNEIFRILNFCNNVNDAKWKKIINKHADKSIKFDKKNSIFDYRIKKLISKGLD